MKYPLIRPDVKYAPGLPIIERKDDIIEALKNNQVIIVSGETGSGKTTQLPVICLQSGRGLTGKIGCTQPRRIAALSISEYLAHQLNTDLGQGVGYKIRFAQQESAGTCIKFMTDGILLAEMRNSPNLNMYDTLIIDEVHERSLNIDFILGYIRELLPRRPDLKVILSSATIDTTLFSKAFDNAPVIEVSGRVYPVEVFYRDFSHDHSEVGYVDETIEAVKDVYTLDNHGDILIFLPTERDIRETCNRLNGMKLENTTVLPLFSRLSRHEQSLIFKGSKNRKIVVATNIAETSITVPGIRFVIDSGLARISEYAPRLRTNRLPISTISKASADQRKGRSGRVMDGICIRLYTHDNYLSRDHFTLPEIKRSNLAGVILSMIAYRLGDVQTFPFLEPPSKQAITEGYAQLRELGAIDNGNKLTSLGKQISRFPLDPHIARMIIAARDENALLEVKIIAAALSIIDPRERPFERRAEADAMHKRFTVPGSDPLTFVRLWDAYQDEWHALGTQNKMRRFCKEHFLSYTRMQEWHDVHQLISEELARMNGFHENSSPAHPDAVHRALLSGLIVNCAVKNDKGKYQATRGREVVIFPGSTLSGQNPGWISCHEIVETSNMYARGVFPIKPDWLVDIAAHLCIRTYTEPWFDKDTGFVRATERISLFGLPVAERPGIHYGAIDPVKSNDIFIRHGLVDEQLESNAAFYRHNKTLRREIEKTEAKLRSRAYFAGENALYEFYATRLRTVTSLRELNMLIREKGGDGFLIMTEHDICAQPIPEFAQGYPDIVSVGGRQIPLQYSFRPGEKNDGVTIRVDQDDLSCISSTSVGWMLPAIWPETIAELLRRCPKDVRKVFMPVEHTAQKLALQLSVSHESFNCALAKLIEKSYGIKCDFDQLAKKSDMAHLSIKVNVHDQKGKLIESGDAETVLAKFTKKKSDSDRWQELCLKYEIKALSVWDCGEIPEHIQLTFLDDEVPLFGYPALKTSDDKNSVDLCIFRTLEDATRAHVHGVQKLLELSLRTELAWLDREIKLTPNGRLLCAPLGGVEKLHDILYEIVKKYVLQIESISRTGEQFEELLNNKRKIMKGIGYKVVTTLESSLIAYGKNVKKLSKMPSAYRDALKKELDTYIENLVTHNVDLDCFFQYPRYLSAFTVRMMKLNLDPAHYREKHDLLEHYFKKYADLEKTNMVLPSHRAALKKLRLMVEEFAISLFAQQEIKTLFPVSTKRLDKQIESILNESYRT